VLTDGRLFAAPFDVARAERLFKDHDLAERVEVFVGRFARLQDTLGDKLLPVVLSALGESQELPSTIWIVQNGWVSSVPQTNGWPCVS